MKHLKKFETYSEKDVRDALIMSQKKQDIEIKTSIDNVMKNLDDNTDIKLLGTFKGFVKNEGRFISEGDKSRMSEYIQEFKKLGLDVSKAEELLPKYKRYWKIEYDMDYVGYPGKGDGEEYARLLNEQDALENDVEEFEKEIPRLAKEAKELL